MCFQPRSSSDSQPPEAAAPTGESLTTEADIQFSPLGSTDQELPFTEVHAQLAPEEQQEEVVKREMKEEVKEEEKEVETSVVVEADVSMVSEGVGDEYALSSTLPQEEKREEEKVDES